MKHKELILAVLERAKEYKKQEIKEFHNLRDYYIPAAEEDLIFKELQANLRDINILLEEFRND